MVHEVTRYNWQLDGWPTFALNPENVEKGLFDFAEKTGRVTGAWQALPETTRWETLVEMMTAEALKTSKIEGEMLDREDIFSSIRKNLGLHDDNRHVKDRRAAGIAALMIDVRDSWRDPLTAEKLFAWHKLLMAGNRMIQTGSWRTHAEPMQVVSGALGREKVHYEAPPSSRVPHEMERFLAWFNKSPASEGITLKQAPIRCAIAHLYFETIHPFEDGNGRIGRAVAEKALSQGLEQPLLLSLSEVIESDKKAYYEALKQAQRTLDATEWVRYFMGVILQAQTRAEARIDFTLRKARFFDRFRDQLNERQRNALRRKLERGAGDEDDSMDAPVISAGQYASLAGTSKATATRDLQALVSLGALALQGDAGGRSTKYRLVI